MFLLEELCDNNRLIFGRPGFEPKKLLTRFYMPKSPRKRLEISECTGKNYAVTVMYHSVWVLERLVGRASDSPAQAM